MYLEMTWNNAAQGELTVEACRCPLDEILVVYEKYKHMDRVMSDAKWLNGDDFSQTLIRDLWQAIKASVEPPPDDTPTP